VFNLLLTSPPYYHPVRTSSRHGIGFTGDLERYADRVSAVLFHCSKAVVNRRVCIIKTDIWHKGTLIPIGNEIASACIRRGLALRAHWIWERLSAFSPYGPSFANIYVFGDALSRPYFSGVITNTPARRRKGLPSSFVPEIFGALIELLTHVEDVVLDPFAGIGGVLEAAASHGRRSVGIELSTGQCRRAVHRLSQIHGFVFNQAQGGRPLASKVALNG